MAAQDGRFQGCKLILEKVGDMNPANQDGATPFHIVVEWAFKSL